MVDQRAYGLLILTTDKVTIAGNFQKLKFLIFSATKMAFTGRKMILEKDLNHAHSLAQINSKLADFEFNKSIILENIQRLSEKKAELIVFSEASLFGYHPFDLLERSTLVDQQNKALKEILKMIPQRRACLIGGFEKNENPKGRPYYNTVCFFVKKIKL